MYSRKGPWFSQGTKPSGTLMRPGSLAGAVAWTAPAPDSGRLLPELAVDLIDGRVELRGELRRGGRDRLGRLLGGLLVTRRQALLVVVDDLLVVLHRAHELVVLGLDLLGRVDAVEVRDDAGQQRVEAVERLLEVLGARGVGQVELGRAVGELLLRVVDLLDVLVLVVGAGPVVAATGGEADRDHEDRQERQQKPPDTAQVQMHVRKHSFGLRPGLAKDRGEPRFQLLRIARSRT